MKVKKKDRQDPFTSENPSVHLSIYHLFYNEWRSSFDRQDYHIWKSQDNVLQLSSRGHVHAETESSLPKTYSTRRGPLLLYSQVSNHIKLDTTVHKTSIGLLIILKLIYFILQLLFNLFQYLVSLETSFQSQPRDKKKVIMQRYAHQTDQHWGAVRELTSAFSINRNNQVKKKMQIICFNL